MQPSEAVGVDGGQRVLEHLLGFRREAGDQIGTEDDIRTGGADAGDHRRRPGPRVPALHPLEHQIVRGLQAQVQVRHQPRLFCEHLEQPVVHGRRIQR